jgi:hypothetical protein
MKTLLRISKHELTRVLLHIPLGLLVCLFGYVVGWWLAAIFSVCFVVYELNQDWHISDGAFTDLKGLLWGLAIGGIAIVVLKLTGVI